MALWLATPSLSPANVFQDAAGTTPCAANSDPIKRWTNAANASKPASYASSSLVYIDSGVPAFGVVVYGTGIANDYLSLGTGWDGSAFTAYFLWTPNSDVTSSTDINGLFAIGSSSTSRLSVATGGAADGGFTVITSHGSGTVTCQSTGNILADGLHCVTIVWQSSGLATWIDRTAGNTSTPSSAPSSLPSGDEMRVGVRYGTSFTSPLDGGISSVLLYHAAHDATNRGLVWDYLGVAS